MPSVDIKKKIANPFGSDSNTESNSKPASGVKNDLESQSVQELESYAASKAEETTDAVSGCVRIAEAIREDATRTMVMLNEQRAQISRNHDTCTKIDQDLTESESLLGSLGGMFSRPWKANRAHKIEGPVVSNDEPFKEKETRMEQRGKLGLDPKGKTREYAEPTSAMDKVQVEKQKQDDALDDLSGILGQLKGMAVDMGSEIGRQSKSLDGFNDDVDELNSRVKGAHTRSPWKVGSEPSH